MLFSQCTCSWSADKSVLKGHAFTHTLVHILTMSIIHVYTLILILILAAEAIDLILLLGLWCRTIEKVNYCCKNMSHVTCHQLLPALQAVTNTEFQFSGHKLL